MTAPAAASVVFVDASATLPGNGTSWLTPYTDLQDALDDARQPGSAISEIRIAAGTYRPDHGTLDRNTSFELVSGVKLLGSFGGALSNTPDTQSPSVTPTILSGDLLQNDGPGFTEREDNSRRILSFTGQWGVDNAITLDGLTIRGGAGDVGTEGSAMRIELANLTLSDCLIEDNLSQNGAAVRLQFCGPLLLDGINVQFNSGGAFDADGCWEAFANNSIFSNNVRDADNQSTRGGGLWLRNTRIVLRDCIISNNTADRGGGAAFISADVILQRVKVLHNQATSRGGGIEIFSGETAILQSYIVGNTVTGTGDGGGVSLSNGIFDAVSTLWWANTAGDINTGGDGGALHVRPSLQTANLLNCAFLENTANTGGAIAAQGPIALSHCTLWSNQAQTVGGVLEEVSAPGPTVIASILWDNADASGITASAQLTTDSAIPATGSYISNWQGAAGDSNSAADPGLIIRTNSTFPSLALEEDSPCIDAANADDLPRDAFDLDNDGEEYEPVPIDFAGSPRVQGSAPDIGATESIPMLAMAADLNGDGVVDVADLAEILSAWGPCDPKLPCPADLNRDTAVNTADIALLIGQWTVATDTSSS